MESEEVKKFDERKQHGNRQQLVASVQRVQAIDRPLFLFDVYDESENDESGNVQGDRQKADHLYADPDHAQTGPIGRIHDIADHQTNEPDKQKPLVPHG